MSWSREKQELRRKICQAARQIAQAGYVAANDWNLSARCSDGGVLITPSGVYKGDLVVDMLLDVYLLGRALSGTGRPSSESPMHLALYRTRPEVGGVVHTHAPYSVFSANLGEDLTEPITADWALLLGPVPALPWLPLGTEELAGAVARAAEEMGLNPSTAKTRLRRGREKLKEHLRKAGFCVEEAEDLKPDERVSGSGE